MCITGADPGFFLGGGALVSCSTSTPINHIVFFCRIPVVLENCRSSLCSGTVYAVIYEVDNTKNRSEPLRGITHA